MVGGRCELPGRRHHGLRLCGLQAGLCVRQLNEAGRQRRAENDRHKRLGSTTCHNRLLVAPRIAQCTPRRSRSRYWVQSPSRVPDTFISMTPCGEFIFIVPV